MIDLLIQERYHVELELGRGGMGVVYRAEDTLLERPVAIKFVSAATLGTEGRARLLQEARAAARLNHPHIVAVYDVGQAELPGQEGIASFIVMELVEGQTLREVRSPELARTIDIAIAICEALAAAHAQGIVHRDLKPENVTVTHDGSVKLMDFGLARIAGQTRLTQEGALVGTLSYLAPEIIQGQAASARSDLYALGVMLYEMSAGRPPFEGDSLTAVISQHLNAPVVPPSAYNDQIPPALDQLISQLLSKRPEERPASAADVSRSLASLSQGPIDSQQLLSSNQLNRLVRGRMVGRELELAEAVSLWQKSAAGAGQLLLISGEPGIGKTRLVKELNAYAEISGGKSLVGYCYAQERTPYGPIAQMVQRSLENGFSLDLPQPVLADLLTLAPELRLRYPDITANDRLDRLAEQQRLFESIITWFGALTAAGQLLLVIEDLHWADSGSLALLGYMARRLARRRAMIVGTYREVELDEALPFQEMLRDMNRERLATRVKLLRLDKEQTWNLLATLFAEEITPEFLDGIYRETEGNPFFVEEVCKSLVDSGRLYFEGGRWQRPEDIKDLEIPQGIRSTIQSRLGKLSPEEQKTLQVAALLGRDFEYEMLAAVTDLAEESLIDVLEKAESAQLVDEVRLSAAGATPSFTFTHALIHSTLLSNLSTLRRQRLQRQVALALEQAFPERRQELAPLLGRYFVEAGDGDKGVKYLLAAGDSARELFAYSEAIEAYEQALLFLKEQGNHERAARTLMKLGLTYHTVFAFDSAQEAYKQGFAEWQQVATAEAAGTVSHAPAPHPLRAVVENLSYSLDPSFAHFTFDGWVIDQLFSGLLQLTAEDELLPDVAESWEVLDGGRAYVFHLRHDVKWSDGKPVTAADFEYAWKRALHPDNDQGLGEVMFDISGAKAFKQRQLTDPDQLGIQVVDSHTLIARLEGPSSYFLQIMAITVSKPVPRHIVEQHGPGWVEPAKIVTNGPFTPASWSPDRSLIRKRHEQYHGRFKGNLSRAELKVAQGTAVRQMYERDELDILHPYSHLSFTESRRFIQQHPDDYVTVPDPMTLHLVFDVTRPPFDNPGVRQALVLAIDRESLANRLSQGLNLPAGGGLVPPGVAGHVPGIALPYDPALAGAKLADAGYPGGKRLPALEGTCYSFFGMPQVFEHIANQWRANLGLELSLAALDIAEMHYRFERDRPNLWLVAWKADYLDPDNFLRVARWLGMSGWRHEPYETLVEDARHIADQGQRLAMYRQAEQILVDEAPIVPIGYVRLHTLVKPWLPSLPLSSINGPILKDIVIQRH